MRRQRRRAVLGLLGVLTGLILAGGGLGTPPAGASTPVAVPTVNAGWFDATGFHDGNSTNYITGSTGLAGFHGGRLRSFFVFDLSGLSGQVVSADLSLQSYGGAGGPNTLTLYDVSTPPATLAATANGATQIFDDLGSGTSLGAVAVPDPTVSQITVPLSAAGLTAVQSRLGGTLAVGGDYAPGATTQQNVFESTGGGNGPGDSHPLTDVQLTVTMAPSPTTTAPAPTTTTTRATVVPTTVAPTTSALPHGTSAPATTVRARSSPTAAGPRAAPAPTAAPQEAVPTTVAAVTASSTTPATASTIVATPTRSVAASDTGRDGAIAVGGVLVLGAAFLLLRSRLT